jgi:hypothetical protein
MKSARGAQNHKHHYMKKILRDPAIAAAREVEMTGGPGKSEAKIRLHSSNP